MFAAGLKSDFTREYPGLLKYMKTLSRPTKQSAPTRQWMTCIALFQIIFRSIITAAQAEASQLKPLFPKLPLAKNARLTIKKNCEKLGIIIQSAEIADAMKIIHDLAWQEAKRLETNE